jgi:hypothetical protein
MIFIDNWAHFLWLFAIKNSGLSGLVQTAMRFEHGVLRSKTPKVIAATRQLLNPLRTNRQIPPWSQMLNFATRNFQRLLHFLVFRKKHIYT